MRTALLASFCLALPLLAQDPPPPISEEEFKKLHEQREDAAPPRKGTRIDLGGDQVYLSLPANEQAPLPAVIVIHEWWGLNQHIEHWADRLANEGYAALAVDLYGGKVAKTPDEASALMKGLDEAKSLERLRSAVKFLMSDERVKATKVASIGWCLGGAWSLKLALAEPELDACVIYYGRIPTTDPEKLKAIAAPVCGVFATRDPSIPNDTVDALEKGLAAAGVKHEVHRYDAEHAFANPSGKRYASKEASDAWEKTRAFLAAHLR